MLVEARYNVTCERRRRSAAGLEGGSARVAGRQLMDLWDSLCTVLAARQVSVEDVSNKASLKPKPKTAHSYLCIMHGAGSAPVER